VLEAAMSLLVFPVASEMPRIVPLAPPLNEMLLPVPRHTFSVFRVPVIVPPALGSAAFAVVCAAPAASLAAFTAVAEAAVVLDVTFVRSVTAFREPLTPPANCREYVLWTLTF
jgi:hypothetical protein